MSLSDEDSVGQLVTEPREHVSASLHIGYQLLMHMYWKLFNCMIVNSTLVHVYMYVYVYIYVYMYVRTCMCSYR